MSDYEVTLVNDNSKFTHTPSRFEHVALTGCVSLSVRLLNLLRGFCALTSLFRQEFYVRFKGPSESESS